MYSNSVAAPRLDLTGPLRTQDSAGTPVAMRLMPPFTVEKKSATMPKLLLTGVDQVLKIKRAPKTAYKRVEATLDDDSYTCEEAGIEVPVDASDYDVLGQDGAEEVAVNIGKEIVITAREAAIADIISGSAGETLLANQITEPDSGENWAESGGKPIDDVAEADAALTLRIGAGPRALLISQSDFEALQTNEQVRAEWRRIVGQTDASATGRRIKLVELAMLLGVDEVIVGDRRKNTANPGQTASYSYIWPARYAFLFRPCQNASDLTEPCFGRTMMWDNANLGAEAELESVDEAQALFVESYRDESIKSDVIRVSEHTDQKILHLKNMQMIKLPAGD